ncbi:hypothetical protein GVX81_06505 [[Haemophilus] felis]|uniref:Uncharacterized protein n=1 Tax=[Haemophilus] felis TaxID=123822 RepID=A0A1T0AVG7_9PAST|nr:hypothetical protein [[Haemophilus] felis]NBI41664.1 hypothetical protein [[Haemophilus] felis]NBI42189.1 hypothetical protein [[Haemophilus] felis]OOS01012.1 hypothetical protein B0188_10320 [[Haemophilus] felis]
MANLNEQWESGLLGRDEAFVARSNSASQNSIDDMLALQAISIRLPKALIQDLKDIAQLNGLGYQPLIKQILNRFVDAEKRMLANEAIQEKQNKLSNKKVA